MSRFYCWIVTLCLWVICPWIVALPATAQVDPFSTPASASFANQDQFLPVDEAFQAYAWHDDERVYVGLRAQPGHYFYRHRLELERRDSGSPLGAIDIPGGKFKQDPYLGDVYIFYGSVVISAPAAGLDNDDRVPLTLAFQGCAEAGLCYPPERWNLMAVAGGPPAALIDASSEAQSSPLGDLPTDGSSAFPQAGLSSQADPSLRSEPLPQSDPLSQPDPLLSASALSQTSAQTSNPALLSDAATPALPVSDDGRFEALLRGGSVALTLGLFFLAGLGLTFTPCVLPMIPILTSIIVGRQASRGRALLLSASYVAGMAVTFTLLGTLMGLFGASLNLQARLQSPWVLVPMAALFVLFAVAMFGGFDLRLPTRVRQRADAWQERLHRCGPMGLAGAGALSVLVVSPCVSAPLAGALVFISTTGNAVTGALALLALGLGMGLPLLLVGGFGSAWIMRAGAWMNGVKALFGVLLLGVAIWLVERLLPAPLNLVLWGLLALGCGLTLGALDTRTSQGWPRIRQALGWLLMIWGSALIWGAAQGGSDPLRPLATRSYSEVSQPALEFETVKDVAALDAALTLAAEQGRPVMVDISAQWCISCKIMEREVFPRPDVRSRLAQMTLIRADVTQSTPASRQLLNRYALFGPPGLLFFSGNEELRPARIQGEVGAAALTQHLDGVLATLDPARS